MIHPWYTGIASWSAFSTVMWQCGKIILPSNQGQGMPFFVGVFFLLVCFFLKSSCITYKNQLALRLATITTNVRLIFQALFRLITSHKDLQLNLQLNVTTAVTWHCQQGIIDHHYIFHEIKRHASQKEESIIIEGHHGRHSVQKHKQHTLKAEK